MKSKRNTARAIYHDVTPQYVGMLEADGCFPPFLFVNDLVVLVE